MKRGEIPYLKSFESDHTIAEAIKIFKVELDENDGNYAFFKNLRPHCESLLKQMTSEFSLDHRTFLKRFAPFVDLDTVIDWLHTLAFMGLSQKFLFFLCENCGQLSIRSTGELSRHFNGCVNP